MSSVFKAIFRQGHRFLLSMAMLCATCAVHAGYETYRPLFIQAERALAQGRTDEVDRLLASLGNYPLHPWLLAKRLSLSGDGNAIATAIARYPWTRQVESLRAGWMERLAARGEWSTFERYYRDSDGRALQCGHYLALAARGQSAKAYAGAEELWMSGGTQPSLCERLFALWRADPAFDSGHIWKRYSLALHKNNATLLAQLESLLPPGERGDTVRWRRVHDHPQLVLDCALWSRAGPVTDRIFAHGVERLAHSDPLLAQTTWSLQRPRLALDPDTFARVDRKVATALATERYQQAEAYLLAVPDAHADAQTRAWRVRAALRQQDWSAALAAIAMMTPEEQTQGQWRYWRARALEALGEQQEASTLYQLAATERDFHGYLAADRLGQGYPLREGSAPTVPEAMPRLLNSAPFLAIQEWRALGRDGEARMEFVYIVKRLSSSEQAAAAKLAQQWGWDSLAIVAVAKSGSWSDLSLRFPLAFHQPVMQQAQQTGLNPALLFGVIRRESAFDPHAGSSVGARGLMQLMPATGEQLARRFNETLPGSEALYEPERNIRYGSAYLRGLLDRFGRHYALATASYNAGPNRVDRWLPAHSPLPADIWIETIPVSETRQYVSAVIAHAAAYQRRLGQPLSRISSWLPPVLPGPKAETKPDRSFAVPSCEGPAAVY